MSETDRTIAEITGRLQSKNDARDRALVDSRQVVRHAANAIRALHRGDCASAEEHLAQGRRMVEATRCDLVGYPDLYWAGYVQDAQKELAEANLVAAMIQSKELADPTSLGVEDAPFLNGLAEAASEMRRYALDVIRVGGLREMEEAERVLTIMDNVYTDLTTVDFPDSITGGLRRTVDALRAVLERTRGDLTLSTRQAELARALAEHDRASSL